MKDVFIINTNAGLKAQYEWMQEIKENYQGKRIVIEKTKGPRHATHIAQKYALKKEEPVHIFAAGGDGTIHEIVNGIAGCDHIQLSILPIGTGNDFIKSFEGLSREDFLNLNYYKDPILMDCDLLKIDGEYAVNTVSFGFDVHVAQYANEMTKKIHKGGIVPYYLGMLASLRHPLGEEYDIQIDDIKREKQKYTFVVCGNGRYYGGGYKPCPDAMINDGKMDVFLIGPAKRREILQLAKEYEKGTLAQKMPDRVILQTAKVVSLNTDNQTIYANLDGEIRPVKNPTIEVVKSAIHLALPKK